MPDEGSRPVTGSPADFVDASGDPMVGSGDGPVAEPSTEVQEGRVQAGSRAKAAADSLQTTASRFLK